MKALLLFLISCLLVLFSGVWLTGCKGDEYVPAEPPLPPATQVGANTFGCRIDGKVFIPDATFGCFAIPPIKALDFYYDTSLRFHSSPNLGVFVHNCPSNMYFYFIKDEVFSTGNIVFDTSVVWPAESDALLSIGSEIFKLESGQLKITRLDTTARIISGTFSFDLSSGSRKSLIRDGRFDLKYPKL